MYCSSNARSLIFPNKLMLMYKCQSLFTLLKILEQKYLNNRTGRSNLCVKALATHYSDLSNIHYIRSNRNKRITGMISY